MTSPVPDTERPEVTVHAEPAGAETPVPQSRAQEPAPEPENVQEPRPGAFPGFSMTFEASPSTPKLLEAEAALAALPESSPDHEGRVGTLEAIITVRSVPKLGNTVDECEDATHPGVSRVERVDQGGLNIGIADGATSYSYSRRWAELALEHLNGLTDPAELLGAALGQAQEQWSAYVREHSRSTPQSWFSARKLKEGSHCTLVTLQLYACLTDDPVQPQVRYVWNAAAVGDSCLVHLDPSGDPVDRTGTPFPLDAPEQYSSAAYLLPSLPDQVAGLRTHVPAPLYHERFDEQDAFLLMTDALAVWFLTTQQAWATGDAAQRPMAILEDFLYEPGDIPGAEGAGQGSFGGEAENGLPSQASEAVMEDGAVVSAHSPAVVPDPERQKHLAFAAWADELRQRPGSALKDDDLSFVHVRFRRPAWEG